MLARVPGPRKRRGRRYLLAFVLAGAVQHTGPRDPDYTELDLHLAGVTEITRTLQAIARDRNRILDYLPL